MVTQKTGLIAARAERGSPIWRPISESGHGY
jgi:hypothetical protein